MGGMAAILGLAMLRAAWQERAEHNGLFLVWFAPFLAYFVLDRLMFDGAVPLPHALVLLAASGLTTTLGTYTMSSPTGLDTYFYGNFSITVPAMAVAVFHLVLHGPRLPRLPALVPLTLGVYLVQPAVINAAMRLGWYAPGWHDA